MEQRIARAGPGEQREHQVRRHHQRAADPQARQDADAVDQRAGEIRADEGDEEAEGPRDPGDLALAEADLEVERVGHQREQHVARLEQRDEREDHQRDADAVAQQKVAERLEHRLAEGGRVAEHRRQRAEQQGDRDAADPAGARAEARAEQEPGEQAERRGEQQQQRELALAAGRGRGRRQRVLGRRFRLRVEQHGEHADQHEQRHRGVGRGPAREVGEPERAGRGHPHADAIAGDVVGGARAELVLGEDLDPVGVDHDVLAGREEGDQQRDQRGEEQVLGRIGLAEAEDRADQAGLGQQQPAAAAAEGSGQHRQRQPVHQGRPEELERVGRHDEAEQADRRDLDAVLGEPGRERAQHQQQRQPAGEAEQQDREHALVEIDLEPAGMAARRDERPGEMGAHAMPDRPEACAEVRARPVRRSAPAPR